VAVVGLAWTGLWAYRTHEESEALETLAGAAAGLNVNAASLATVNDASPALPPPRSEIEDASTGEDARAFVERRLETIRRDLREGAPDELVTRSVDALVDYDELTRRSLGKPCPTRLPSCTNEWDRLADDQQRAIALRMRQIVGSHLRRTLAQTLDCTLAYAGDLSIVRTDAKRCPRKSDEDMRVDYVVRSSASSRAVVEIVTEGSSTTANYYNQFHRMLSAPDQGYAYLIERLDAKLSRPSARR